MKTEESEIYFVFDYASGENGLKRCLIKNGVEIKVDIFEESISLYFFIDGCVEGFIDSDLVFFFFLQCELIEGFFL